MTEEKKLVTSEVNIFFNEHGEIGMGGGLHIKLIVPGTPTVETIQSLVDRVHEWGVEQEVPETAQDKAETAPRDDSALDLHCPRKGVWAAAKGNWPEGLKPDWKHNDPRMSKKTGVWFCPTPINKDLVTGQLVWCTWRARELEDGTYQEFDVGDKE